MISIIVCSRSEHDFGKLRSNIEKTIGSHFEVIRINNTNNQYNIFQAYNEGVRRSKSLFKFSRRENVSEYELIKSGSVA